MDSALRIMTATAALAALLGCASERPTNGHGTGGLPTANLSDSLVLAVSAPITAIGQSQPPGFETTLTIPDSLLSEFGPDAGMTIEQFHRSDCGPAILSVYDNSAAAWVDLGNPNRVPYCSNFAISFDRWMPAWAQGGTPHLFGPGNVISLRGNFDSVQVRMVKTAPNYCPRLFIPSGFGGALHWTSDGLFTDFLYRDYRHVIARVDPDGSRGDSIEFYEDSPSKLISSASGFWAIDFHSRRLELLDKDGVVSCEVEMRTPSDIKVVLWEYAAVAEHILWVPATLGTEIPDRQMMLLGIDLLESVDSGYTVIADSLIIPERLALIHKMQWDGEVFHILTWDMLLCTLTPDGQTIDSLPLRVNASSMAWDGEAYWISHSGPTGLYSSDVLLSRFYPR